jgi:catechol 2,3-dioxygenase-like lactoylglutathione lyase family enzyme
MQRRAKIRLSHTSSLPGPVGTPHAEVPSGTGGGAVISSFVVPVLLACDERSGPVRGGDRRASRTLEGADVVWQLVAMAIPQQISFVTVGSPDVSRLRSFYEGWGWSGRPQGDGYVSFDMDGVRFAICDYEILLGEAPGPPPNSLAWNGVVLSINVSSKQAVDQAWTAAVDAGATALGSSEQREWGGYSGYVADPQGHRWEIAAPEFEPRQ